MWGGLHNELLTHANTTSYVSKMTTTCDSPAQGFTLIVVNKIKKACLRTSLRQLTCFAENHLALSLVLPFPAKKSVPSFRYKALAPCVIKS